MKERLLEFLKAENKSSAQLAEEIGVQPSGISHILSGRNNPSLDFVLKMLDKYPFLSTEWLLFGKGMMYKENKFHSLFDEFPVNNPGVIENFAAKEPVAKPDDKKSASISDLFDAAGADSRKSDSKVTRIVMFYQDNSFEEYFPKK
jgi:transcriptional regulator with XRE-family HTH domain